MRTAAVWVVLAAVSTASAAEQGTRLATLSAPKSASWLAADRWTDDAVDRQAVVRLTGATGSVRLKLAGAMPPGGAVLLRVRYVSSGAPFGAALGNWTWATGTTVTRPKGWQTLEMVVPVSRVGPAARTGDVDVNLKGEGNPAVARVDLLVPTAAEAMAAFRQWVRDGTADAWTAAAAQPENLQKSGEPAAQLLATAQDQARGAVPMVRSYTRYIFPDSIPTEHVARSRLVMTPGEHEPFQFAIRALKDFPSLSAEVVGAPKGLAIDLRWVECVPVRVGGSRSVKFRVQPDRLWPKSVFPTCAVKAGQTQAWWAIVKADDDLAAGAYPVKLAVRQNETAVAEFDLDVVVLPFRLPKRIDQSIILTTADLTRDDVVLSDLVAHGVTGLAAFASGFSPVANRQPDFAAWDDYFALLKRYRLDRCFFWYLGNPRSGNTVKRSIGEERFVEVLKGLQARVADGRYPPTFCVSIDEAVMNATALQESKDLYQVLRRDAPALKLLGCVLSSPTAADKWLNSVDMLEVNGSFAQNSAWCKTHDVLLNTYSYVCAGVTAGHTRLNYGFLPYQYGSAVVNGWAMTWFSSHPYNDLDGGLTDWGIFLPNWAGPPISTPSWEGLREGVDDLRYVALLADLVRQGRADGQVLDEIRASGVGKMKEMRETVVGDSIFGAAMQDAADLDIARARIVQAILAARPAATRP